MAIYGVAGVKTAGVVDNIEWVVAMIWFKHEMLMITGTERSDEEDNDFPVATTAAGAGRPCVHPGDLVENRLGIEIAVFRCRSATAAAF